MLTISNHDLGHENTSKLLNNLWYGLSQKLLNYVDDLQISPRKRLWKSPLMYVNKGFTNALKVFFDYHNENVVMLKIGYFDICHKICSMSTQEWFMWPQNTNTSYSWNDVVIALYVSYTKHAPFSNYLN